jgi:phosphoenolpyruvate-protein phosphotransferase (PTS system enzyme I)
MPARSFGYGLRVGTIRSVHRGEPKGHSGDHRCALNFEFAPDARALVDAVTMVHPAFCIVPPCSPYSHLAAAIWANDVPTLSLDEPWRLPDGVTALADFEAATLYIAETQAEVHELDDRVQADVPTPSIDAPCAIEVLVEPACASDVIGATAAGADGLSVIRAEQLISDVGVVDDALAAALRSRPANKPIYLRFFDPSAAMELDRRLPAPQPALGYRGIRVIEIDDVWLAKFIVGLERLALDQIVVVVPMTTAASELRNLRSRLGPNWQRMGVTVETPAAAVRIGDMLSVAEFVQIGLNDLTQYTMAWDRDIPCPARLPTDRIADPVADLIGSVAATCAAARAPYTLGLDLRPSPTLAAQLVALGVNSISCARSLVRPWKNVLATLSV